ncbi:hypothetical protein A0J48_002985 [Sphaerospermopsis aphanizomenoides BCCUSP55]|uniref:hypothetical protein n=1 Tax=Sphaerospermopsis aphanizomenoides TaxID=459663 RepID=UPI0019046A14|nr:hypothetical protein [Sphaerospermopsis aphanizomenoides]MBK1986519.1 hypothetical protein [Sphaerospermopsis aphanizomenoides BCCUSP55]
MVSSFLAKTTPLRSSKIVHKSSTLHPQARFVTEEAVCVMFQISFENIYTVECWRYVVYVHGKGLSKFVSYADFPPIIGVGSPTTQDCIKWRKRWRKHHNYAQRKHAPYWWTEFFTRHFGKADSEFVLKSWWQLIALINFAFSPEKLDQLRSSYNQQKTMLLV